MRKIIFIALFLSFLVFEICAQKQKVAVLEPIVENKTDISTTHQSILRSILINLMTISDSYEVYTRSDIDAIVEELTLQQSGMVSDSTIKSIGQLGGVDLVCISKLSRNDKFINVELSLINVESGKLEKFGGNLVLVETLQYTEMVQKVCKAFLGIKEDGPLCYYLVFNNQHSSPRKITIQGEYIGTVGGYETKKFTVPLTLQGECKSVQTKDYIFSPNVEVNYIRNQKENSTITIRN